GRNGVQAGVVAEVGKIGDALAICVSKSLYRIGALHGEIDADIGEGVVIAIGDFGCEMARRADGGLGVDRREVYLRSGRMGHNAQSRQKAISILFTPAINGREKLSRALHGVTS